MDDFTAKSKKVVKEMLNFTGKKTAKTRVSPGINQHY
jgi:hypothetical protein